MKNKKVDVGGKIVDLEGKHYHLERNIESAKRQKNQNKDGLNWRSRSKITPKTLGRAMAMAIITNSRQALRLRITLARYGLLACFAIANHSCEMKQLRFVSLVSPDYFSPTAVGK